MVDIDIRIRSTEADDTQPTLLWDTVWNPEIDQLDWALAGPDATGNSMGLQAIRALDTAILLQLATWRRAEPYDVLPSGSDPKGWWGDSIDLEGSETRLGCRIWLIYRNALNQRTVDLARQYVIECLQPIIDQGVVVRFDVTTWAETIQGMLAVQIAGYSQSGQRIYDQKFTKLWQQEFS